MTRARPLRTRVPYARATSLRVRTTLGPAPLVPTASLLPAACALAPITWLHAASPCGLLPSIILPTHAHAYAPTMGHTAMLMPARRILLPLLLNTPILAEGTWRPDTFPLFLRRSCALPCLLPLHLESFPRVDSSGPPCDFHSIQFSALPSHPVRHVSRVASPLWTLPL